MNPVEIQMWNSGSLSEMNSSGKPFTFPTNFLYPFERFQPFK